MEQDVEKALRAISSMIDRSEKAHEKFQQGTSQHTLLANRIFALRIASCLIQKELLGQPVPEPYPREALEKATKPIASLISKSEKAQQKLAEGTWQHTMLQEHLGALYLAAPLLSKALASDDALSD